MNENQKGFGIIEISLVIIVAGVLGATGWYAFHTKHQTDQILNQAQNETESIPTVSKSINNFNECASDLNNKLQGSYPEVCVAKNGKKFTQAVKLPEGKSQYSPADAVNFVKSTYSTYIKSGQQKTGSSIDVIKSDLEDSFYGELKHKYTQGVEADLLLCAQNLPDSISTDLLSLYGNTAAVRVVEVFGADSSEQPRAIVNLVDLKIINVSCHHA
jgi:Tfp pilus assembly protein PilV